MTPTIAWLLLLTTACSVGALAYALLERRKKTEPELPREWSLTPRSVFNAHERRVHRQLREALPQQVVLAKLPLVRFCHPTDPAQVRFWFDLLGATNVSFAICSPNGRVLAAIDLDDGRAPTRRTMLIKQAVLAACHIRYVRYDAEHTPSVPELQLLVPAAAALWPSPTAAVMNSGLRAPSSVGVEVIAPRTRPGATAGSGGAGGWADSRPRKDSTFGRDSVISGFSHSLPSVLPERSGEVIDSPPTRH